MLIFIPKYWKYIISIGGICMLLIVFIPSSKPSIIWLAGGDVVLLNTDKGIQQVYEPPKKSKRILSSYMRKQKVPLITEKPNTCDSIGCIYSIQDIQILALEKGVMPTAEDCYKNSIILPLKMHNMCKEEKIVQQQFLYSEGWVRNGKLKRKFYNPKQVRIWQ